MALRAALPAGIEALLARGSTAACLWLAVALSADPAVRVRQLERVAAALGPAVGTALEELAARVRSLPSVQHLPLLQRALPALKSLPAERRRTLVALTAELATVDGRMDVHEYLRAALATRYLGDQLEPVRAPGRLTLEDCQSELGVLFAILAQRGSDNPIAARRAYELGLAHLLPRTRADYRAPDAATWNLALDGALARLAALAPAAKELLIDALGRTVLYAGVVAVDEAELLRAVAALLHCPLPPLFAGTADG